MAMVERRSSVQDTGSARRRPAQDAPEAVASDLPTCHLECPCGVGRRTMSHPLHARCLEKSSDEWQCYGFHMKKSSCSLD
eukprot:2558743-Prymnesium_polylepis.1